ncbi:MAG: spermidine/putrescine transporter permease [Paenibacillus sp.]|nr:spermidine/putrescine transporter permease [Paenibacillus sp.]
MTMNESRNRSMRTALLLLAPGLAVVLGVFLLPMLYILLLSFQDKQEQFSFANYLLFVKDPFYIQILWRTVKVSLS